MKNDKRIGKQNTSHLDRSFDFYSERNREIELTVNLVMQDMPIYLAEIASRMRTPVVSLTGFRQNCWRAANDLKVPTS
jgi:hypothetical protein